MTADNASTAGKLLLAISLICLLQQPDSVNAFTTSSATAQVGRHIKSPIGSSSLPSASASARQSFVTPSAVGHRSLITVHKASVAGNSDWAWESDDAGIGSSAKSAAADQSRNNAYNAQSIRIPQQSPPSETAVHQRSADGTATTKSLVPSSIFNLIKAVIGCGVLALPSGLAAVSDSPMALIPAVTLVSALGVLSGYTFGLYGRLVHQTQAKTLGEIWERQKSKSTAWVVSLSSLLFCFGASLSYTIMLGDVAESFTQLAGVSGGIFASRSLWVSILAVTTLRPLCNLSSLAALAPMSLVGVFAILFTSAFVGFRCPAINPASPYSLAAGGGALLSSLTSSQMPLFNTFTKGILHPASLILGGMAATAFLGHFSAPDFYHTLKEDNEKKQHAAAAVAAGSDESSAASTVDDTKSKSIADFLKVTTGGFSAIIGINAVLLTLGFLTFGGNSMGILLNNYSSLDPFATFCRLIMAVNVIGGFPFVFRGCRSEVMSLLKKSDVKTERKVTNVMMSLLVGCSMLMKNAGLVIGFNGAVMGSAIVYIFPALLFLSQTGKLSQLTRSQKMERWLCRFLVAFGGVAVVAGGAVSIINGLFPHLLA